MNSSQLITEISQLIDLHQEGEYWDFKKEWYKDKSNLLHDIMCMANNLTSHNGFIIIGIDEETNYSICDMRNEPNRRKTQDIVSFLREKKFAGGIRPTVSVQTISFSSGEVDVIVVHNDNNTPYYLIEQFQGILANHIYTRVMDTNTPKNSSADVNLVEKLWRKRFGINAAIIDRVMLYLQNPCDWESAGNCKKYYIYAPEFAIEYVSAREHRNGYEFFLFGQCDTSPDWYDINIYYHQTLLSSLGGAALDGWRCFTATPQTDGICLSRSSPHWDVTYRYFIIGSLEYIVHRFNITDDMDEEQTSRNKFLKCVLVFNSELEKDEFDRFAVLNYSTYKLTLLDFGKELPYFPEIEGYNMEVFRKQYLDALLLQRMLDDFRNAN